jgi:hypothetical protein
MLAMMLNVDNDIGDDVSNVIHDMTKLIGPHIMPRVQLKTNVNFMWRVYSPRET